MYSTTGTSPLTEEQDQPLPPISVQYPFSQTPKKSFLKMGLLLGMTGKQQVVSEHRSLTRQVSKGRIMDSRCLEEPKDKPQISKHCTGPVFVPQQFASPSSSLSTWPSQISTPENRLPLSVPQFGNILCPKHSDWHRTSKQIFTEWTKGQSCYCGQGRTLTAFFF